MIYTVLFLLLGAIQVAFCLEKGFTINVEPLKEDCFFQPLKDKDELLIEYQVIDGGHGDFDISFNLLEPNGRIIVGDFKKPEKIHKIEIKTTGDYRFCFDNTFSSFNTKTVYFEIDVSSSIQDDSNRNADISFEDSQANVHSQQIEGFYEAVGKVRTSLTNARILQELIKVMEAKDRSIAEEMYFKVNSYSMFVLILMMLVSFVQILMVKSIFDDKSKIYKVLCFLDITKK